MTLFNNNDTSLLGTIPNGINNNGVDTPDFTPGNLAVNTNPRNGKPAFNTALFSLPALGQIGTADRRFFYGPGIANFDAALHKTVPLSESRSLELRFEAFNVFNHAQFYGRGSGQRQYQQRQLRADRQRSALRGSFNWQPSSVSDRRLRNVGRAAGRYGVFARSS